MTPTLKLAADLMALAGKATPGEWHSIWNDDRDLNCVLTHAGIAVAVTDETHSDDCHYIAACNPTNITALCNAVKGLSEQNARLREAANDLLENKSGTFGHGKKQRGIEGDDGEKCWIVHSDYIAGVESAIASGEKT